MRWFLTLFRRPVDTEIGKLMKPPVRLYDGHDESKAILAQARREQADTKRQEAARILSGSHPNSRLIVVDKEAWRS